MRPAIETGLRLLALTAWCAQAIALPPEDKSAQLPSAKEIIERALERADWLKGQKVEEKYTFSEAVLAEKLHADKSIRQREHSRYEVYPVEGVLFRRLVEKNGRPPSAEETPPREDTAISPPLPPLKVLLTITIMWCHSGTSWYARFLAVLLLIANSR